MNDQHEALAQLAHAAPSERLAEVIRKASDAGVSIATILDVYAAHAGDIAAIVASIRKLIDDVVPLEPVPPEPVPAE